MIYHCAAPFPAANSDQVSVSHIPMPMQRDTGKPLIAASHVSLGLGGRLILNDVSLRVDTGRIVTLIGPNGAGKTTMVRVLLGLIRPDSGSVERAADLTIGYMPQRLQLDSTMPISVTRFLALTGVRDSARVARLLNELRISHLADSPLREVSGGELQRVLLCRALLREPRLLILDEPAQGVDVVGQAELYQLIDRIAEQYGCGILMISHDLHLVMSATDEVVCLNQHICCHGKPEHVSNDPAYLALFGKGAVENIAVYTHKHDHSHDIHGNVIEEQEPGPHA